MPGESEEHVTGQSGPGIPGAIALKIRFAWPFFLPFLLVTVPPLNRVIALQNSKSPTQNPNVEAAKPDSANPPAPVKSTVDDKAAAAKPADFKSTPPLTTQDK